ncbi:MAG: hypothetical protein BMS9Abin13_636 [Patescibacteria group bacterium]|nr:MAG: hypothetical protein BMS9Abin13_636 [Patescibacteria group bacterium]
MENSHIFVKIDVHDPQTKKFRTFMKRLMSPVLILPSEMRLSLGGKPYNFSVVGINTWDESDPEKPIIIKLERSEIPRMHIMKYLRPEEFLGRFERDRDWFEGMKP